MKTKSQLRGFDGRCLRRILSIRPEQRATDKDIAGLTHINNIVDEVKQKRQMTWPCSPHRQEYIFTGHSVLFT